MELIWPWDHFAIGFTVVFVIGIWVISYWPWKIGGEINTPAIEIQAAPERNEI